MLIIAATDERLEELLDEYDVARTDSERERIAGEVFQLIGGAVRGMITRAAGNQRLTSDQLDSLAWQALFNGLNESGVTRFKRSDAEWETFIEHCRQPGHGPGNRIWGLLSQKLKKNLEAVYTTATTANMLVKELNSLIRRRDIYDAQAWAGVPLNQEATELLQRGVEVLPMTVLSRMNALLVSAAFPEIRLPERPPRHLMGYLAGVILKMKPLIYETASGERFDQHLQEAFNFLRPDIDAVKEMETTGTLPEEWLGMSDSEKIYQHQKRRLQQRYGKAIQWWDGQLKAILGSQAFRVADASSLRDARSQLEENGIDPKLWRDKGSPNYLPTLALHPYGTKTIERLLVSEGTRTVPSEQAVQPAITTQPQEPEGYERIQQLLSGGHAAPAYRWLVDRLFSRPGYEAEHAVGLFLARNPNPSRQQVEAFVETLPDELAGDIDENGWDRTVRDVDRQVLDSVRDPKVQTELAKAMNIRPQSVVACLDRIRRIVFIRTARLIEKQMSFLKSA